MLGFKAKFNGGEVKGNLSSDYKVQSVYRKFIGMFDVEMVTAMDLGKP